MELYLPYLIDINALMLNQSEEQIAKASGSFLYIFMFLNLDSCLLKKLVLFSSMKAL